MTVIYISKPQHAGGTIGAVAGMERISHIVSYFSSAAVSIDVPTEFMGWTRVWVVFKQGGHTIRDCRDDC